MKVSAKATILLFLLAISHNSVRASGEALNISGAKTFKINSNLVEGNFSQFVTEHPEEQSGFSLDQSLRLQIDGHVTRHIAVKASLDDTRLDKEQREITVFIRGKHWDVTLGDFHLKLDESEFALYRKKVQGILITGQPMRNIQLTTIITRSEGEPRSEEFMGKGAIEEYRLGSYPIVENSDAVWISGRRLQRHSEYFIDYEDGTLFFDRSVLPIEPNVKIRVDYEYIPSGSPYKRSLLGFRLAGILGEDRRIGYNYIQDIDNRRQPVLEITPDSPKPSGQAVYSVDLAWRFNDWLMLEAEGAYSEKDDNLLSEYREEDKMVTGHAHLAKLTLERPRLKLRHYRSLRSPTFFTIGRDDLSVDLQRWRTQLDSKPLEGWEVLGNISRARRRIINDPNPDYSMFRDPVTVRTDESSGTIARTWRTSSLTLYAHRDNHLNTDKGIDNIKRTGRVSAERRFGLFKANTALELERFENTLDMYSQRDSTTSTYGLGYSPNSNINASVERVDINVNQDYDRDGEMNILRSSITDTRKLDLSLSREYNASLLHIERGEADYSSDSFIDTVTADLRFRAQPIQAITTDWRYSEQHVERYIRTGSGAREENPVRTRNAAIRLNLRQSRNTVWDLRFNHMDEADMKRRLQETWVDRWEARLRHSPARDLSTELRYRRALRERRKYLLKDPRASESDRASARDDLETEFTGTLRKAFARGLTISFSLGKKWNQNQIDGSGDDDMLDKGLAIEHPLTDQVTIKGEISRSDGKARVQDDWVDSRDWTNTYGLDYTPFRQMKISLNHQNRLQEKDFAIRNSENRLDLDYLFGRDTRLSGAYRIIDSGPTVENSEGYRANMASLDVVVRF